VLLKLPQTQSILVVDDELDIVVIFRQALSKYGYTVFGFTDPALPLNISGLTPRTTPL
jgi:CheY-like chemotaxis protein